MEGFLSEFLPSTNIAILDWGGDTGKNTPFRSKSSLIHIYDPSNKPVEIKSAVNIYASKDFLDSCQFMISANVLEHAPFPEKTLNKMLGYMTSKSIL